MFHFASPTPLQNQHTALSTTCMSKSGTISVQERGLFLTRVQVPAQNLYITETLCANLVHILYKVEKLSVNLVHIWYIAPFLMQIWYISCMPKNILKIWHFSVQDNVYLWYTDLLNVQLWYI